MIAKQVPRICTGTSAARPRLPKSWDGALLDAYPEIWEPLPDTAMQEKPYLDIIDAIRGWYGEDPAVFVSGNTGVYYEAGNRRAVFRPDCYVAFGPGADRLWWPYAYRVWEFGRPPAFALEIGSRSTWRNDLARKRELYARVGIREYWRYDPSGGDFYGEPLVGEYLVDGAYRRFEMRSGPLGMLCAHSPTLELDLCSTAERLRLYDPAGGEWLGNVIEEREARLAERQARLAERHARLAERDARLAERQQRLSAEAEIARLQAELRRLRGE